MPIRVKEARQHAAAECLRRGYQLGDDIFAHGFALTVGDTQGLKRLREAIPRVVVVVLNTLSGLLVHLTHGGRRSKAVGSLGKNISFWFAGLHLGWQGLHLR